MCYMITLQQRDTTQDWESLLPCAKAPENKSTRDVGGQAPKAFPVLQFVDNNMNERTMACEGTSLYRQV